MYYCYGIDGVKYGPCDLDTLKLWVAENRLTPETRLVVEATGVEVLAGQVPGLFSDAAPEPAIHPGDLSPPMQMSAPAAPAEPEAPNPYATPPGSFSQNPWGEQGYYQRPAPVREGNSIVVAWILFVLGICSCSLFTFVAVHYAKKAQAEGHPQANLVYWLSLIYSILQVIGLLIFLGLFIVGLAVPS